MANVVVRFPVPAWWRKVRELAANACLKATVWLDENSDWLLLLSIAIALLALAVGLLAYLPMHQRWSR